MRHLIDEMAFLQMNSLGVGVYGCWVVQYEGKRTEFLMVPFPEPLSCYRCVRPASVVINGKLFCGECFLVLLQRRPRSESK